MEKSPQPPHPSSSPLKNDSPSRQLFSEAKRHAESQPAGLDSPSRQLWREFSCMLIDGDRRFHDRLEQHEAAEREKYRLLLAEAAERHEEIRRSAERVAERVHLEEEQARKRREDEQKRELERIRRENAHIEAEKRQRELDEVKRREEEQRRAAEHARRVQEAEERLRKQKAAEAAEAARRKAEKEQQEHQEAAAKETAAREAAQAAAKAQAQAKPAQPSALTQPPATNGIAASSSNTAPQLAARPGIISSRQERDAIHGEYLAIHQRLKKLRNDFKQLSAAHPQLKDSASRIRRSIRMKIGQITHQAKGNREKLREVRELLLEAQSIPSPTTDIKPYLASSTQARLPQGPFEISVLFLFELHHFCKSLFNQFISDAGINASHADSLGILGVSLLGNRDLCLMKQVPLSDILLAKFHHSCGVLFGICGPENLQNGRRRLGWRCLHGDWETEQGHRERMTGIGGGWASLCLRKYKLSTALIPPFTPAQYWTSFARIVDTPAAEAQPTHFNVLRAMTDGEFAGKFIDAFGRAGWAALRKGLVDFPQGHDHVSAKALASHVEEMKKSHLIALR
ncbi:GLE1-like protein-domain-containing protein [Phyllosticta citrichinensis]|uniref:mRNA export factor GLE1 n=1 Tax=Phyllosticta citrichinensis TaxID=1130410 RepID=A0ABR1XTX7_9PEZI